MKVNQIFKTFSKAKFQNMFFVKNLKKKWNSGPSGERLKRNRGRIHSTSFYS